MFQSTPGPEGPSDHTTPWTKHPPRRFQSTPGPEGPSDSGRSPRAYRRQSFNPRPVPKDRATQGERGEDREDEVSIHARSRRTERPRSLGWTPTATSFNPRPVPKDRATPPLHAGHVTAQTFQSTPGPEGPSDMPGARAATQDQVSIHARSRRTERLFGVRAADAGSLFQSTPGPEGPSDHRTWRQNLALEMFQSTPGPEGPSDSKPHGNARHTAVSIHARSRRTERPARAGVTLESLD